MDNLTHSLVGALIGQTGLKRKTGLAMPALIIGANIPDIDAACIVYGVESLAMRRGITHGPIAWVLLPLLLAWLLYGFDKWQVKRGKRPQGRLPVHFGWLYALSFIACLSHPALDWLNVYGIRLLEPFSSQWFYGDTLFIIDVWLWLGMGLGLWLSLRREKRGGDWRKVGRVTLSAMLAYIGVNAAITGYQERMQRLNAPHVDSVIASPVPLAFWRRDMIVELGGRYNVDGPIAGNASLADCDLAAAREQDPQVDAFLFWSRTPVLDHQPDGAWRLSDARYYSVADGRFSVTLPDGLCSEPTAE